MSESPINARPGKLASAALPRAVAAGLRARAELAMETYHRSPTDTGISSLHSAANLVATMDRSHPSMYAINAGQGASNGQWQPTPGEDAVLSHAASPPPSVDPIAPDVLIAELGVAALEGVIAAERTKADDARQQALIARQRLEQVQAVADRVPSLEDELCTLRARIEGLEGEIKTQVARNEFLSARFDSESAKPAKPRAKVAA